MHGVSDADFEREFNDAKANGNTRRMAALQTAKEIIELLEFEGIQGPGNLKMARLEINRKIDLLDITTR